jgi:hypothetical protein
MKAIVVRQPWATLIALGIKTIETRPFPPNGEMRPDGVRGLPGCTLVRGERIAIVAGATDVPERLHLSKVGEWALITRYYTDGLPEIRRVGTLGCLTPDGSAVRPEAYTDGHAAVLPLGAVVATVTIADALPIVAPMTDPPNDHLCVTSDGHLLWWAFTPVLGQRRWSARSRHPMLNERTVVDGRGDPDLDPQLPLGDYRPGRWGWLLTDPQPLATPVPCKGRQGVFELPADVAEAVTA